MSWYLPENLILISAGVIIEKFFWLRVCWLHDLFDAGTRTRENTPPHITRLGQD